MDITIMSGGYDLCHSSIIRGNIISQGGNKAIDAYSVSSYIRRVYSFSM